MTQDEFIGGNSEPFMRMKMPVLWAMRLMFAMLITSLAGCQSSGAKAGNTTSRDDVMDPNISFSKPSTREGATP
jgi:hypothetical protein